MLVKFLTKDARVYDVDRNAMEKKINLRLSRYFAEGDEPNISVKIKEEKSGFKAEITLTYYRNELRAECKSPDAMMAAFDLAVDTIEKRMAKYKDKVVGKKKNKAPEDEVPAPEADFDDELPVRVKRYSGKPMTAAEAIEHMDLLGHTFFTFRSSEEDKVCTVYKRYDGGYGLIVID